MDNRSISKENLLQNFGGTKINSLTYVLPNSEDENEIDTINCSQYYSLDNLPNAISYKSANLLSLSLNAQSILSKSKSIEIMIHVMKTQNVKNLVKARVRGRQGARGYAKVQFGGWL